MLKRLLGFYDKLKLGEKYYFCIIILIVIFSVYIAYFELGSVGKRNKEILEKEIEISSLQDKIDQLDNLDTQFHLYYTVAEVWILNEMKLNLIEWVQHLFLST